MMIAVMMGVIACVAVGIGALGLVEFRSYTATQRGQAPVLMALKVGLAALILVLGIVNLGGLALGLTGSVFDASLLLALTSTLYVFVDRWLLTKLDSQQGPLERRWTSWWKHPAER